AFTIYYAFRTHIYGTIPFLMLFFFGYGYMFMTSLFQGVTRKIVNVFREIPGALLQKFTCHTSYCGIIIGIIPFSLVFNFFCDLLLITTYVMNTCQFALVLSDSVVI